MHGWAGPSLFGHTTFRPYKLRLIFEALWTLWTDILRNKFLGFLKPLVSQIQTLDLGKQVKLVDVCGDYMRLHHWMKDLWRHLCLEMSWALHRLKLLLVAQRWGDDACSIHICGDKDTLWYLDILLGTGRSFKHLKQHLQGLVNVPMKHHPTIGDIMSNRYLFRWCETNPQGHLPSPDVASKGGTQLWSAQHPLGIHRNGRFSVGKSSVQDMAWAICWHLAPVIRNPPMQ